MSKTQTSEIKLSVALDENKIPNSIHWTAEDGGVTDEATKAVCFPFGTTPIKNLCGSIFGPRICLWMK